MPEPSPTAPRSVVRGRTVALRPGRRLSIAVSVAERGASRTVLFVHGAGGRKNQWRRVWPIFAEVATCVAWDGPGHGDSPPPPRPADLAGTAWVEDALALLDAYGRGRTVIVAHSYGCRIALGVLARLAERGEGERIAAALLLAPPPPGVDLADGVIAREPLWRLARRRPKLERGFRMAAWSPEADPALVDAEERAARRNRLSTLRHLMRRGLRVADEALAGIAAPVTVLAGADDRLTPPAGAEALAARLTHGRCEVLEGCGHQIMLERPRSVALHLARLLEAEDAGHPAG